MIQEIVTEHLDRCPFCGGKAELKVAEHPFNNGEFMSRVSCTDCHSMSNSYLTGHTMAFKGKPSRYVTLAEAKAQAMKSWNRRPKASGNMERQEGGEALMTRKRESANFATEILSDMKRQLIRCRIVLAVSLAGNVVMAAILTCR